MAIILNGKLISNKESDLLTNRGFLFGDGFFESMIYSQSGIFLWKYHWCRIEKSAAILSLNIPAEKEILSAIEILHPAPNSRLKIVFFRRGKGTYLPAKPYSTDYIIICQNESQSEQRAAPISLGVSTKIVLPKGSHISSLKSLSSLSYVLASMECRESSFDDLIILNNDNEIVECTASNIYIIKGNRILTPPLNSGCVAGVCRSYLLGLKNIMGFEVVENKLNLQHLEENQGLFLSNAVQGIRTVKYVQNKQVDLSITEAIKKEINKRIH